MIEIAPSGAMVTQGLKLAPSVSRTNSAASEKLLRSSAIASVNPATALLEAGRSLIAGDPAHVALAFGAALFLAAGFLLWAFRGLKSAERAL